MSDIIIKSESEDNDDADNTLSDLTAILQEVKKEEQILCDEAAHTQHNRDEQLPDSFFDDLYREEIEAAPEETTTDADIQKLQELIAKKKRILNDDTELSEGSKSRSRSPDRGRRKENTQNDENLSTCSQAKRPRTEHDTSGELVSNQNESPAFDTPMRHDTIHQPSSSHVDDCLPSTKLDPELELENILKTEDFNPDAEPMGVTMNNLQQPMYPFPGGMPMMPAMYNPATNQMMANMSVGGYPMMCNMGFPPGFYPPNMMNMQMMGYGSPQMNVLPSNDNEVQCLPVVSNPGLPKIPFKKIKLETNSKTVAPAEDPKKKIIDACTKLLETMNINESTGKFVYTSTVTKNLDAPSSNSILLKITNVSYNFQSISQKQNLEDWGLIGIPNRNAEIAKKISISADKYFTKIAENANTTARKLIKQEAVLADKNQAQEEMETEEVTLSSYFKNSMTQTDALVCRKCVERKSKVGHDISVQATVFTGNIDTQTDPEVRFNEQLTQGLSDNQLKAMYEFSLLIREPPKNTSEELIRLRDRLINMYNLSQRLHNSFVPPIDTSSSRVGPVRDPRVEHPRNSNLRSFPQADIQNQMIHQHPVQTPPNFSQHGMQKRQQQMPSAQYPGRMSNDNIQVRPQAPAMQIPNHQRNLGHPGYAAQGNEFAQQDGRKKYGRGGLRR